MLVRPMKFLVVLASGALGLSRAADPAGSLGPVLETLQDIQKSLQQEGQTEAATFAAFQEWCAKEGQELGTANGQAKAERSAAATRASELQATGAMLTRRLQEIDEAVVDIQNVMQQAEVLRKKQKTRYDRDHDLNKMSLDQVIKAIALLRAGRGERAKVLLQQLSTGKFGATLRDLGGGGPGDSGIVIGVLEQIAEELQQTCDEFQAEEQTHLEKYNKLTSTKKASRSSLQDEKALKTDELTQATVDLNDAKRIGKKASERIKEASKLMKETEERCTAKSKEFKVRTEERSAEIQALKEALDFVKSASEIAGRQKAPPQQYTLAPMQATILPLLVVAPEAEMSKQIAKADADLLAAQAPPAPKEEATTRPPPQEPPAPKAPVTTMPPPQEPPAPKEPTLEEPAQLKFATVEEEPVVEEPTLDVDDADVEKLLHGDEIGKLLHSEGLDGIENPQGGDVSLVQMLTAVAKHGSKRAHALRGGRLGVDPVSEVKAHKGGAHNVVSMLISQLQETQKDDSKKKQFCETELESKGEAQSELQVHLDGIKAAIEFKTFENRKLEQEAAKLSATIDEQGKSLQAAAAIRKREAASAERASKDRTLAVKILGQAVTVLEQFYAREDPTGLLQQSSALPPNLKPKVPPKAFDNRSTRKDVRSKQAVERIRMVASDLKKEKVQAVAEERKAAAAFELLQKDSRDNFDKLMEEITIRKSRVAKQTVQLTSDKEEQAEVEVDLEALAEQIASLHKQCDKLMADFEKDTKSRDFQIAQLRDVIDILAGSSEAVRMGIAQKA